MRLATFLFIPLVTIAGLTAAAAQAPAEGRPPQGDEGIAAKYPGDVGIEKDPAVIVVEDFEDEPKLVKWMQAGGWSDMRYGPGQGLEMVTTKPAAGKRCLQFNLKQGKKGSGRMMHKLPATEEIYFRYYRRFAEDWVWPRGYGPHDAFLFGGKFLRPTDNDFQLLVDYWRTGDTVVRVGGKLQTGLAQARTAWQESIIQKHGRPSVGGPLLPWNVSEPDKIVPGKWHCAEAMVKMSTPGKNDGVVRLWVNGKLVSDFTGAPLRDADHANIAVDKILIGPYFHPGSPRDQTHWVDQIVIATKYIGPIATKQGVPGSDR